MEKSGAESYIYAKASGILKNAWLSENAVRLFNTEKLSILWEMIFNSPVPAVPELMLANKIETESVKLFVKDYVNLLEVYDKPAPILISLLREFDVQNLKAYLAALSYGEEKHPRIVDIGLFRTLDYDEWPNLKKITDKSPYNWVSLPETAEERQKTDFKLDLQLYKELYASLQKLSGEEKEVLSEYFLFEWSVKNLVWALRLKVYYNFSDEKIIENLYYVGKAPSSSDPICHFAFEIFGKKTDSYEDWEKWRFAKLLNPREESGVWKINPMWIEQRFRSMEYSKAKRLFHQYPMTDVSLAMFFVLKKQELNCIRAAVESLRLGSDKREAMYVAGITGFEEGDNGKNY